MPRRQVLAPEDPVVPSIRESLSIEWRGKSITNAQKGVIFLEGSWSP